MIFRNNATGEGDKPGISANFRGGQGGHADNNNYGDFFCNLSFIFFLISGFALSIKIS